MAKQVLTPARWNLLTQAEAARELGVTRARVGQLLDAGLVEFATVRGRRYVLGTSLAVYMARLGMTDPPLWLKGGK